jgi:hypothetical protein
MHFHTHPPRTPDVVLSVLPGYWFDCPNLATLDAHLQKLLNHLGPRSNLTDSRKQAIRADIDRLLERRMWLQMCEMESDAA